MLLEPTPLLSIKVLFEYSVFTFLNPFISRLHRSAQSPRSQFDIHIMSSTAARALNIKYSSWYFHTTPTRSHLVIANISLRSYNTISQLFVPLYSTMSNLNTECDDQEESCPTSTADMFQVCVDNCIIIRSADLVLYPLHIFQTHPTTLSLKILLHYYYHHMFCITTCSNQSVQGGAISAEFI
jgi:hypothetical protein